MGAPEVIMEEESDEWEMSYPPEAEVIRGFFLEQSD